MSHELERIKAVYRDRMEPGRFERYSLARPGESYILQQRERAVLRLLRRAGLGDLARLRILEVGCGRGRTLADWVRWGASPNRLCGIDLMEPFVREAAELLPRAVMAVGAADRLPFGDRSFDIVAQFTMFTSILDPVMRQQAAAEMRRVLAPGGAVLWYDFRYPSPGNRDVRPVRLPEIRALFPDWPMEVVAATLLPPLARRLAGFSVATCRLIETTLPPLRSHYLALIRRPDR